MKNILLFSLFLGCFLSLEATSKTFCCPVKNKCEAKDKCAPKKKCLPKCDKCSSCSEGYEDKNKYWVVL